MQHKAITWSVMVHLSPTKFLTSQLLASFSFRYKSKGGLNMSFIHLQSFIRGIAPTNITTRLITFSSYPLNQEQLIYILKRSYHSRHSYSPCVIFKALNPTHQRKVNLTLSLKRSNSSSSTKKMNQLNQAKNIWRKAHAICFDVDSTVIQEEAIDELAKFCGKGDEVEQLTMQAMQGGMDFRQALALRLDLIRPSSVQLRNYIYGQKHRLTPYVKELVHELHKREKEVYLISGGFKSIIEPVARDINVPTSNIYANKLKFYYDGEYAGFDEAQLTSRSGGKGAAIRDLKEKHGYETVVMIGDGITDWEAAPPADLFIGFGGNAYRAEVKNKSKWYVTDFRDLINELRD